MAAASGTPTDVPAAGRRERTGWYFYDWANSGFQTTGLTVFLGPFLTSITKVAAGCQLATDVDDCAGRVHPLGISVPPGSFYPYVVSLSVFLSVLVLPVMGAVADRTPRKKLLLAVTAFVAAAATIGFVFVTGGR